MIIIYNNIEFKQTMFEDYFVSKCGEIVSIKVKGGRGATDINSPRIHSKKVDKDGYFEVCISFMEKGKQKRVYRRLHRLVYETWKGKIKDTIDHIDKNKQNNNIDNLRDLPREENTRISTSKKAEYEIYKKDGTKHRITVGSFVELAKYCGISEGSVRQRLRRNIYSKTNDIVRIAECND